MSEKYLANRLKYHAASRIASQEGEALLQALTLDGHTVATSKVWAGNRFPENTAEWKRKKDGAGATADLVNVFKNLPGVTSTSFNGGTIWHHDDYDVELYENVLMTPVAGSNGSGNNYEAYEILDNSGNRIQDWVSPMAAFDSTINAPIPGFTGIFQSSTNGSTGWQNLEQQSYWVLADGTWEFAYIGGMLTFDKSFTPVGKGRSHIRLTAFKYVGKYLNTSLTELSGAISSDTSRIIAIEESLGISSEQTEQNGNVLANIATLSGNLNTVSGTLNTEITTRSDADEFLSGVIDTVSGNAGIISSALDTEITARSDADEFLSGVIDTVSGNTGIISSALDTEITTRNDADEFLSGVIDTVSGNAGIISSALDTEITTRSDADEFLSGVIDSISGILSATSITGTSAIIVDTENNASTVSLKIDANDKVLTQSSDGLLATIGLHKITDGLASGIASEYYLTDKNGNQIGTEKITIYKDQHLKSASYDESTKKITLEFNLADESIASTYINLSGLVDTYEASSGLQKIRGTEQQADGTYISYFTIKLDANCEKYLTVSQNGLKLNGIENDITSAVNALSAEIRPELTTITTNIQSISTVIDSVSTGLSTTIDGIETTFSTNIEDLSTVIDSVSTGLSTVIDSVSTGLSTAIDTNITNISNNTTAIREISSFVSGIPDTITNANNEINVNIESLSSAILSGFNVSKIEDIPISGNLNNIRQEIADRFTDLNNQLSGLNDAINDLTARIEALNS